MLGQDRTGRQGAAGGRPKHVSLVSKLASDQGHSTIGANITKLWSFPSNLLSSVPGVGREILGRQSKEQNGEQTPWGLLTQKDMGRSSYLLCVFEPTLISSPAKWGSSERPPHHVASTQ